MAFVSGLPMKPGEVAQTPELRSQRPERTRRVKPQARSQRKDPRSDFEKPYSKERLDEAKALRDKICGE